MIELFFNKAHTTVAATHGVVAPGTVETMVVASSGLFADWQGDTASTGGRQFRFVDANDQQDPPEVMLCTNVTGTSWTVTRGVEGTAPTLHPGGFTVQGLATSENLETSFAGGLAYTDAETARAEAAEASLQYALDFTPRGAWATATEYVPIQTVEPVEGQIWMCIQPHTSGNFDTDKGAGCWRSNGMSSAAAVELPADAPGVLTDDGTGDLSWGAGGSGGGTTSATVSGGTFASGVTNVSGGTL